VRDCSRITGNPLSDDRDDDESAHPSKIKSDSTPYTRTVERFIERPFLRRYDGPFAARIEAYPIVKTKMSKN
jgi:hypothetical protein